MFPANSRYRNTETNQWTTPDGRVLVYLTRRFLPNPESVYAPGEHSVVEGDRLDNLTARYLGDPELFWLVCDANICQHPDELTADIGRLLRIPMALGV